MANEPTRTFTPWVPDRLVNGVTAFAPTGISRQLIMFMLDKAMEREDVGSVPALENLEATVSIVDDAILHAMRKR